MQKIRCANGGVEYAAQLTPPPHYPKKMENVEYKKVNSKIEPELEPLAEEARKSSNAKEFAQKFYAKLKENNLCLCGWNWDKKDGVIRRIITLPFQKGAIKTEYSFDIDQRVGEETYDLTIRRKGEYLSEFDLKNLNLDLNSFSWDDKYLFKGKHVSYSNLDAVLNKIVKISPELKEKPLFLLKIINPEDFYNKIVIQNN